MFFLMIFAVKMSLNNTYGLLNVNILEFQCNHFNSLFLAESELQNSNVGGKKLNICVGASSEINMTLVN